MAEDDVDLSSVAGHDENDKQPLKKRKMSLDTTRDNNNEDDENIDEQQQHEEEGDIEVEDRENEEDETMWVVEEEEGVGEEEEEEEEVDEEIDSLPTIMTKEDIMDCLQGPFLTYTERQQQHILTQCSTALLSPSAEEGDKEEEEQKEKEEHNMNELLLNELLNLLYHYTLPMFEEPSFASLSVTAASLKIKRKREQNGKEEEEEEENQDPPEGLYLEYSKAAWKIMHEILELIWIVRDLFEKEERQSIMNMILTWQPITTTTTTSYRGITGVNMLITLIEQFILRSNYHPPSLDGTVKYCWEENDYFYFAVNSIAPYLVNSVPLHPQVWQKEEEEVAEERTGEEKKYDNKSRLMICLLESLPRCFDRCEDKSMFGNITSWILYSLQQEYYKEQDNEEEEEEEEKGGGGGEGEGGGKDEEEKEEEEEKENEEVTIANTTNKGILLQTFLQYPLSMLYLMEGLYRCGIKHQYNDRNRSDDTLIDKVFALLDFLCSIKPQSMLELLQEEVYYSYFYCKVNHWKIIFRSSRTVSHNEVLCRIIDSVADDLPTIIDQSSSATATITTTSISGTFPSNLAIEMMNQLILIIACFIINFPFVPVHKKLSLSVLQTIKHIITVNKPCYARWIVSSGDLCDTLTSEGNWNHPINVHSIMEKLTFWSIHHVIAVMDIFLTLTDIHLIYQKKALSDLPTSSASLEQQEDQHDDQQQPQSKLLFTNLEEKQTIGILTVNQQIKLTQQIVDSLETMISFDCDFDTIDQYPKKYNFLSDTSEYTKLSTKDLLETQVYAIMNIVDSYNLAYGPNHVNTADPTASNISSSFDIGRKENLHTILSSACKPFLKWLWHMIKETDKYIVNDTGNTSNKSVDNNADEMRIKDYNNTIRNTIVEYFETLTLERMYVYNDLCCSEYICKELISMIRIVIRHQQFRNDRLKKKNEERLTEEEQQQQEEEESNNDENIHDKDEEKEEDEMMINSSLVVLNVFCSLTLTLCKRYKDSRLFISNNIIPAIMDVLNHTFLPEDETMATKILATCMDILSELVLYNPGDSILPPMNILTVIIDKHFLIYSKQERFIEAFAHMFWYFPASLSHVLKVAGILPTLMQAIRKFYANEDMMNDISAALWIHWSMQVPNPLTMIFSVHYQDCIEVCQMILHHYLEVSPIESIVQSIIGILSIVMVELSSYPTLYCTAVVSATPSIASTATSTMIVEWIIDSNKASTMLSLLISAMKQYKSQSVIVQGVCKICNVLVTDVVYGQQVVLLLHGLQMKEVLMETQVAMGSNDPVTLMSVVILLGYFQ